LILDEPMTGLDSASEAMVVDALGRLMSGKTCLTITHDLKAAANADLVLVLEQGQIVERGRPAELLARDGRYRRLYDLQAIAAESARSESAGVRSRPADPA
jgi:ABC-type multidrug transport system fused ATPase/permease subunit